MQSSPSVPDCGRAYDSDSRYAAYADGDPQQPFGFTGAYGFADRHIWSCLDAVLMRMAREGRRSLSLLDVGCGPGTWIRRVVLRAYELGFTRIHVRGFDLSGAMIGRAASMAADLTRTLPRGYSCISIEHGDARMPLSENSRSVDLCLCLYGVLNHLAVDDLPATAAELGRVTGGELFVTVRAAGSLPTIYVDRMENARDFRQDNDVDRMEVDLADGRHLCMPSHLFRAADLLDLFGPHVHAPALHGLDLFHSRFAGDPRWNPDALRDDPRFMQQLDRLEQFYATDPLFIDRAAHIMLHGTGRGH